MLQREARVKEEAERLSLVAVLREDEAEDAESQHLRQPQHLRPSPPRPKYKHQHHRAMSRLRRQPRPRPRPRRPSPTASRLYDPPHHSKADIL
jgi:hypothetical protein